MKLKQVLCACIMSLFVLGSADVAYALPTATEVYQRTNTAVPLEKTGEFNGHSYCVFNLSAGWDGAWAEAKKYCESVGGHLATITSKEENEYVYQFMKDSGFNDAFFGFTDEEEEGVWKWVTGEPVSYTNWKEGEPNDDVGSEDYAMFYHNYADQWNDWNFGKVTAFICEWEYLLSEQQTDTTQKESIFSDVSESAWYYSAVNRATELGYFTGYEDGTFKPQKNLSRAECVTLISRFCGDTINNDIADTGFADVSKDSWFAKYVTLRGDTLGNIENETFHPGQPCTREDFAVGLYYALGFENKNWDYNFKDKDQISSDETYLNAAFAMGANGVMIGDNNGNFNPKKSITRAETAQIFCNMTDANLKGIPIHSPGNNDDVPAVPDKPNENDGQNGEYRLNDTMYYSDFNMENVAESDGIRYLNNEMIIHAVSGSDKNSVLALISDYNGRIVGEIQVTDTYQVRFPKVYSYEELMQIKDKLEASPVVSWCSANTVFEEEPDYFPVSDTKWHNEWNEGEASGLNWGVEAIHAPEAWDYRDQMDYVDVGVIDCCFRNHEDITYTNRYFNYTNQCTASDSHGTHVTGTIGAGFDNGRGISGVAPYTRLYCYSEVVLENNLPNNTEKPKSVIAYQYALTQLIVLDKCHVINISLNTGRDRCFVASLEDEENPNHEYINASDQEYIQKAKNSINKDATEVGKYLKKMIDDPEVDDFVLCVAAGNVNDKGIQFVRDSTATYGYREVKSSDPPSIQKFNGGAKACYNNFLNAITIPQVKDRIIVVGSCGRTYEYSNFSNIGGRVDVVAPGENIYSTVANNGYENNGWNGTSMATPHVSGIAAMLYSIDKDLEGDKVKEIIEKSATTDVQGFDKNMVNAKLAVEQVAKPVFAPPYTDVLPQMDKSSKDDLFNRFVGPLGILSEKMIADKSNKDLVKSVLYVWLDYGFPIEDYGGTRQSINGVNYFVFSKSDFENLFKVIYDKNPDLSPFACSSLPSSFDEAFDSNSPGFLYDNKFYLLVPPMGANADPRYDPKHLYQIGENTYCAVFEFWYCPLGELDYKFDNKYAAIVAKNPDGSWSLLKRYEGGYQPSDKDLEEYMLHNK